MNTKALFSSTTDLWATPQDFFNKLNKEFDFELDVCAVESNTKCEKYYSPDQDGLKQEWSGVCWMNPPYGREIGKWVRKAYETCHTHTHTHTDRETIVVCLLPSRTDTKWFHEYIYGKAEIRFIKGRLKFGDSKNSAPFPSMLVIFRSNE